VKALLNFVPARRSRGWYVSFIAEDCQSPIGRPFTVPDMETLLRVIAKLGGNENRAKNTLFNWGRARTGSSRQPSSVDISG